MTSLFGSRLVPSLCLLLTTFWLCGVPHSTARAQVPPKAVHTDIVGTTRAGLDLGTRTTTTVDPPTNVTTTAITGGTRPAGGPNLFHSFDSFSVGTNDIAHFQNDMMLPTTNIIARVVGDGAGLRQASTIDGILRTNNPLNALDPLNFGSANLFLVNPAGVIFGPNAQLDIKGSFAATTADYLRMTDGALFHTDPVQPSVLSIANVASFGFTSPRPVAISVQAATLQVPTDQMLSLIGGDIVITNSVLRAASGQINLASIASTGEVIPNQPSQAPSLDVSSFANLGQITESSVPGPGFFSDLTVSSALGAGTIVIRAGEMTQDHSFLSAQNLGTVDANVIGQDIHVTGDLILRNSSTNLAQTINARGAGIQITAGRLVLESTDPQLSAFSGFNSSSFGSGRAGDITISARTIESRGNTNIGSNAFASGRGGDVQIIAEGMVMDSQIQGTYLPSGSTVSSNVALTGGIGQPGAGTGQGGIVRLNVGDLQLLNGAQVITATRGAGTGGAIDVQADSLLVSGVNLANGSPSSLVSSVAGPSASGTAGNIHVVADSIVVQNSGQIRADLLDGSPGNAGNIDITAGTVDISNRGLIAASAVEGTGPAGRVDITANDVRISGDGTIDPLSAWLGSNRGFDFPTDLPSPPEWSDATGITTNTNAGRGGELNLKADTLTITDNGAMTSRTIGSGDAGTIDLQIANNVTLTKGGIVSASTSGTGVGGNISVATDTLMLSDGGILSASTFGVVPEAAAGTIRVDATTVSLTGGSQIASDSFGPGVSGAIHITASDLVTLTGTSTDGLTPTIVVTNHITASDLVTLTGTSADGLTPTLVATNAQATGNLGDIVVKTKNLTASGGAHVRTESLGSRAAGSIHVKATETVSLAGESADGVFISGLFANAVGQAPGAGDGGSITVEAKNLTIGGGGVGRAGEIVSSSFGFGDGGTINVTVAEALTIAGISADGVSASGIFADTQGSMPGSGKGGNIFVATKYLSVEEGGWISVASFGSGTSGALRVTATERLTLNGRSPHGSWPSAIVASAESGALDAGDAGDIIVEAKDLIIEGGAEINSASFGPGAGGNINVQAARMTMDNGASVSAASSGTGDAGSITINAGSEFLSRNSAITTEASQASGGNITLLATDMIRLRDSQISASIFGDPTTVGGNILIDPNFIILQNSQIIAQAIQGAGGNINLAFNQAFLADPRSTISASSQFGVSGTVNINSPTQNLSGALVPLEQSFLSGNTLSHQRCAVRMAQGQISTFIVTEREGLPQEPGGMLLSGLVETDGTAASETLEPIRVASVGHPPFTLLTPEPVQLTWSHDTCRRLTSKGSER